VLYKIEGSENWGLGAQLLIIGDPYLKAISKFSCIQKARIRMIADVIEENCPPKGMAL
jgi:hypothetical protein